MNPELTVGYTDPHPHPHPLSDLVFSSSFALCDIFTYWDQGYYIQLLTPVDCVGRTPAVLQRLLDRTFEVCLIMKVISEPINEFWAPRVETPSVVWV